MSSLIETQIILYFAIGLLAVLTLASPKPSLSALLLFFESILVTAMLWQAYGAESLILGVSILLTFFAMLMVGINYYFEVSFTRAATRFPKISLFIGTGALLVFIKNGGAIKDSTPEDVTINSLSFYHDNLSILMVGFALFAILASALTIFEMKNPKPGDSA